MKDSLVTVKTFSYYHETLLIEPQLRAAGIDFMFMDRETATVDPFLSNAIGGIKLQVRPEDFDKTIEILKEIEQQQEIRESEETMTMDGKNFDKTLDECPKCESENIYVERPSFIDSIIRFYGKREHYCRDCKHRWKKIPIN